MQVARGRGEGRVKIAVRIKPQKEQRAARAVGKGRSPRNRAKRKAVIAAKESVNRAFESGLADGVMFERRIFHALFATADQKEGMDAFVNKRPAAFKNQ